MKKVVAILLSLVIILSFSVLAFAEDEAGAGVGSDIASDLLGGSASDLLGGIGKSISDLITSNGGDSEFDFESVFSGIGALGDIDIAGYISNISFSNIFNGLAEMAGGFFDPENLDSGSLNIGSVVGDLGFGEMGNIITDGLGGLLGIGSSDTEGEEGASDDSGFTNIISSVAGSIADMTSGFDIADFVSGLISGSSGSDNNSGNNGSSGGTVQVPTTTPSVNLPSSSNNSSGINSGVGSVVVTTPSVITEEEITTQQYTTRAYVLVEADETTPLPEANENDGPSKSAVAGGVILVLLSFGAIAYIVVRKVM